MKIHARVENQIKTHKVIVATNGLERALEMPVKESGLGSSVNGGEILCLALATCYCNDIYREASKRGVVVSKVEVEVNAEFGGEGEPAQQITYSANVHADATDDEIPALVAHTDRVAEIQNTLRRGVDVVLLTD